MNPIDIKDLSADADRINGGLPDHTTRGPILVTRNGEPEAVIIRHSAYAPRLDTFYVADTGDGDDRVNLVCSDCPADDAVVTSWASLDCRGLGSVMDAANAHWRETHRGQQ